MSSMERKRAAILKRRTTRPEKRREVRLSSRRFRTRILSVRSIKLRKRFVPGTVITDMRYPNYAKDGYECRHNLGYWERKEYLGLGLGASSLIDECRFHNTEDMKKYLEFFEKSASDPQDCRTAQTACPGIREEVESLSREDQMEEFMFLGLRKTEGISMNEFCKGV